MRKSFIGLALLASVVACGGLLGFGEDDEPAPAPPALDASTEAGVVDASGSTQADGSLVCDTLTEDFAAFTDNAQLPDAGWRRFFGQPDCGVLGFDGGAFVVELPAPDPNAPADAAVGGCTATNAGLFRRFEGAVRTLDCSFDVTVDSFDSEIGFFEYRVEQGTDYSTYRAGGGWGPDLGIAAQSRAAAPDAGIDFTQNRAATEQPLAGRPFPVRARLDARTTPTTYTFWFPSDTATPLVIEMPKAGAASFWELYFGITGFGTPGKRVTIDNVRCESCRQP